MIKTLGVGAVTLTVAAVGIAIAPAASALSKAMSVSPSTGSKTTALNLVTAGQCASGDKIQVFVTGSGFPSGGYGMTGKDSTSTKVQGANYSLPLLENMNDAAAAQTPPATLSGVYTFTANCYQGLGSTVLDSFTTSIVFSGNNFGAASVSATLSPIPAQVAPGRDVVLTANLAAVFGAVPAGTVEFLEGSTSLGTANVAAGAASASITKNDFAQGNHTVKAVFTPANTAYRAATTPDVNFEIAIPQTSVVLATDPSPSAQQFSLVTISATVTPSNAVGVVDFFDGGGKIGTGTVRGGIASITKGDLALGNRTLTAQFVPTSTNDFGGSTSAPVTLGVTPRSGPAPLNQTLEARVDSTGTLAISLVPGQDGLVSFGTLALSANADRLEASGAMDAVSISDTRFDNPGWELSAQATPFVGATSNAQVSAAYVSVAPTVVSAAGNQPTDRTKSDYVTAGRSVSGADPTVDPAASAGGLASKVTLAAASAGWRGVARVEAGLTLAFPVSTTPDSYRSTMTLTVS